MLPTWIKNCSISLLCRWMLPTRNSLLCWPCWQCHCQSSTLDEYGPLWCHTDAVIILGNSWSIVAFCRFERESIAVSWRCPPHKGGKLTLGWWSYQRREIEARLMYLQQQSNWTIANPTSRLLTQFYPRLILLWEKTYFPQATNYSHIMCTTSLMINCYFLHLWWKQSLREALWKREFSKHYISGFFYLFIFFWFSTLKLQRPTGDEKETEVNRKRVC